MAVTVAQAWSGAMANARVPPSVGAPGCRILVVVEEGEASMAALKQVLGSVMDVKQDQLLILHCRDPTGAAQSILNEGCGYAVLNQVNREERRLKEASVALLKQYQSEVDRAGVRHFRLISHSGDARHKVAKLEKTRDINIVALACSPKTSKGFLSSVFRTDTLLSYLERHSCCQILAL